jgi:hypothetical protein
MTLEGADPDEDEKSIREYTRLAAEATREADELEKEHGGKE